MPGRDSAAVTARVMIARRAESPFQHRNSSRSTLLAAAAAAAAALLKVSLDLRG
jgi:H+/Cl- antiporter ClcA